MERDVPSSLNPPGGCGFHPRCPVAIDQCSIEEPAFKEVEPDHSAACWLVDKLSAAWDGGLEQRPSLIQEDIATMSKKPQTPGPATNNVKDAIRREITFQSGDETLVGDFVLPVGPGPHPALLNIAGTGSQNRYGDVFMPDGEVVLHGRDRWVSDRLAQAGIASLYWDKRGVGKSTGGDRRPGDPPGNRDSHATVMTDVGDAENALLTLSSQPEIDPHRVVVMGHSAGVFFASLLASRTDLPAGYILWGGVHRSIEELMKWFYERIKKYAARGSEEHAWIMQHAPQVYRPAPYWREILAAARRGEESFAAGEGELAFQQYLGRLKQELAYPLPEQFRHIQKPALVIHGREDVNITHEDSFKIVRELQTAGNPNVTLVIVPGADHSMHIAPPDTDDDTRLREFWTRVCYRHPYSELFIHALIGWTKDQLGPLLPLDRST
jgi:pimeloyl-ACP methyl ester carboxylesterase